MSGGIGMQQPFDDRAIANDHRPVGLIDRDLALTGGSLDAKASVDPLISRAYLAELASACATTRRA